MRELLPELILFVLPPRQQAIPSKLNLVAEVKLPLILLWVAASLTHGYSNLTPLGFFENSKF